MKKNTSKFPLPTYYGYVCQRYYDSQIGRFITLDPVDDKKGTSPYAYCSNDPLKFTDPTGETSMAAEWVKWQMEDDAFFFGTMGGNGFIPYTGWAPRNWFLGSSAELDPDFWAKGWDWSAGANDLIKQAMFILSSGIFEWEVLTEKGWQFINIGEWIKANNVRIVNTNMPGIMGFTGYGKMFGQQLGSRVMLINLALIAQEEGGLYEVAGTILHEATHLLQRSFGFEAIAYTEKVATQLLMQQERQAYSVEGYYFGNLYSPKFQQAWIIGASMYGLTRP